MMGTWTSPTLKCFYFFFFFFLKHLTSCIAYSNFCLLYLFNLGFYCHGLDSVPGGGTEISQAGQHGLKQNCLLSSNIIRFMYSIRASQ